MADPRGGDTADLNALGLPIDGEGVGPTLRPDLIAERHHVDEDRKDIERQVYERRISTDREAEAQIGQRAAPEGSTAVASGQDLTADVLRGAGAGGPGAGEGGAGEGVGATLGDDRNRPLGASVPEGLGGENEQQGARLAHGAAQGGEAAAPDQTRGQGRLGSINETEGA
jgi:hypothetical protein